MIKVLIFFVFQLQERVDNKSSQVNEWEKQADMLRLDLSEKNHSIHEMEKILNRTQEVCRRVVKIIVFLKINTPGAMQKIGREALFCIRFAK